MPWRPMTLGTNLAGFWCMMAVYKLTSNGDRSASRQLRAGFAVRVVAGLGGGSMEYRMEGGGKAPWKSEGRWGGWGEGLAFIVVDPAGEEATVGENVGGDG